MSGIQLLLKINCVCVCDCLESNENGLEKKDGRDYKQADDDVVLLMIDLGCLML
jgi:hypothetical protein